MASNDLSDQLKDLTLEDAIPQNKELGRGAYGEIFTVNHVGLYYLRLPKRYTHIRKFAEICHYLAVWQILQLE